MHTIANPEPVPAAPEVWGGAEYTLNRVGDRFFDQMTLSGHADRPGDLELFASLGLTALRCGLLWERHALDPSWRWEDARMSAMRTAGLHPIVGLVHHGSGPRNTSLLDPAFPTRLAAYAGAVARRFPWVTDYTPVNEPNTTARFAARCGVWYPHHCSQASYVRALVHQVQGIALSMRAIREVQPAARLIQTDDLGGVWSTPPLAETAQLFSERQWIAFDLLSGLVDRSHPLFLYLREGGLEEEEIFWFRDHPTPPDVVGINYYVTSDRFLDHRVQLYPERWRSAEGPFVDLEAVRARAAGIQGFEPILLQAHRRYGSPIAITEVHLGDGVEEQIRWWAEAWHAARRAQAAGVPCRAATSWALLGSYFWNTLVTSDNGHYEPGAFDLRSGVPVETALGELIRQSAQGQLLVHPALAQPGWWQHPERIAFHSASLGQEAEQLLDEATAA